MDVSPDPADGSADSPTQAPNPPAEAALPRGPMAKALGTSLRWRILGELASGEPLMVVQIAEKLGHQPTLISKHIVWLREAGMVETGRSGLYAIPRRFLPSPGDGVVDYGHCLLRF